MIDVLINRLGKPYQTALTILSLIKYSGKHINKIYLTTEKVEVVSDDEVILGEKVLFGVMNALKDKLVHFIPKGWFRSDIPIDPKLLSNDDYRHSIRYQYGWEKSNADFVFISHNDCLYLGDIIGYLKDNIGDNIGCGKIGQCWNCPARWEGVCNPESYENYKPTYDELRQLYWSAIPPKNCQKRPYHSPDFNQTIRENPHPLPECRLNEWACLVNLKQAKKATYPEGSAVPFGAKYGEITVFDTAVEWFRNVYNQGYRFSYVEFNRYAEHRAGRSAMLNIDLYHQREMEAKEILKKEFKVI